MATQGRQVSSKDPPPSLPSRPHTYPRRPFPAHRLARRTLGSLVSRVTRLTWVFRLALSPLIHRPYISFVHTSRVPQVPAEGPPLEGRRYSSPQHRAVGCGCAPRRRDHCRGGASLGGSPKGPAARQRPPAARVVAWLQCEAGPGADRGGGDHYFRRPARLFGARHSEGPARGTKARDGGDSAGMVAVGEGTTTLVAPTHSRRHYRPVGPWGAGTEARAPPACTRMDGREPELNGPGAGEMRQ
jgi:hypothetical protein